MKMPAPMPQAAVVSRSGVGGPAVAANTPAPTTITQTRNESRVGNTRKSMGKGSRAASMGRQDHARVLRGGPWRPPGGRRAPAGADGGRARQGKAHPHIGAWDPHQNGKPQEP